MQDDSRSEAPDLSVYQASSRITHDPVATKAPGPDLFEAVAMPLYLVLAFVLMVLALFAVYIQLVCALKLRVQLSGSV